ncbi:hypothetical protein NDU88_011280 [Pleurodeles waltl]|uniref:SPATA31 domain-containing protein n=1 Tax=Pleurodeles waltl TaxID=8319 RepID=A0AAV7S1R0_PLEWA|nr:hypothetical protein NDU88_011280 [Pleurodeles waltl]
MKYMGGPLETDTCQLCGNFFCQECGLVLHSDGLPDGLDVESTRAWRGSSRKVRQRSLTSSNRGSGKGVPKTSNPSSQSIHHSVSMSSSDESIYGSSLRSAYPRKRSILVDCRDRACPRNCCCFGTSAWKRSCGMATSRPSDKPMRERRSRGRKRYQTDSLQVSRCPRSTTNQKRNSDTSYLSSSTSSSYRMIPSQQSLPTDASSRRLLLLGDTSGRLSSSSDDDLIQSCHSGHTTTYSGRSTPHSGTSLYSDISSMESAQPLESKPAVPISSLCNDEAFSPSGVSQTLPPYARKISFPQIVDIPDSEEDSSCVSHFSCLLQEAQSTRIAHLLRQRVLHPLYGFPEPVAKSQKWAEEKQKTNEKKISQCPGKFVPKIQINDNILTPPMKEDGEGLRSDPSMETSFLSEAIKERLELHLNNKALQNVCGLPTIVQKSQGMFMPLAPKPIKPTPCRKRVKTVLAALVSLEAQQLLEAHLQKKVQKHHSTLLGKISESAQEVLPSGSPRPDQESLKDTAEMNEGPPIKITTQKTDKMNKQQTETCVSTGMEQMPSQVKEFGQNHVFLANSHLPKCVLKGQGIKRPRVGNMPSLSHDVMRSLEQNLSRKHHVLFSGPSPHPTNSQPSLPVESGTSSILLKKKEAGFVESKTGHSRELCGQKKLLLPKGTLPVKRKQSFSVASPPPKMQQKQGVKTLLWPREQKNASSVPKTTSSTSSLGSKPRVANGGSKRRRRRRKCHPAMTKRSQQMLIKGLEPCLPKPLITVSKCLLPRPCPSQEKIRYVQTDGLEPCLPKPLITGSKCLFPRPCPSQEKIRNVQTDGLEPCSPKPLITGSKCLLPRPCPSQENIRYVQTDGLEPSSPTPLITGSKCLLPRPCPSQEKIRNVHTDYLEPCSPKPLITGSKCLLPRPCPSQEKIRNVQTDDLEPCSPKPLKPTPCRKRVKTVLAALVSSESQQLLEAQFQKKVQKHHSTLLGKISESAQEVLPSGSPRPDHESLKDTAEMYEGPPIKITTQKTDKMNNQQTETCVSTGMEQMPSQVKEFGQNHVFLANSHLPKCVFKGQGIKRPRVGNMPSLSHDVMRSLEQNLSRKHHVLFSGPSPHPTDSQPSLPVESGTSSIMLKKKEAGFVESKTGHSRELCGQKKLLLAKGTLPVKRKQSFSVASPPPPKMQQKQGVKTSLWPREQKHASSVPKTTSSTSSLGSKPSVANGGSKRRRRRRRRRKCHPAVTKRSQQMLIKGLEPCSPKPLITGSKCLLPRPCPSQEKIRNVQMDDLEPCSPKPLITVSKCLLPRPCPSQEKIRNVQTDGLEPCSPKPLITGSKCLLPRPCPSQENIRYVQTDGLEPCSPKPLITGSKCLLPRPCPSQEKIRNVQTDGLEPCSPKPLITGIKCLLPRPCPSQEKIRNVQTDGLEPCSPKPLITGSKCLLPRPCPSQEKIRNVQTDGLEPCSPKPLITGSKCLLPRPCPSQEKIRNVQTDDLEPCSPKPLITVSKCLLPRPCPSQEKIRNVQTDGLEPCSPKPLIPGSKCLLPRPCPSQETIGYVQTDGLELCSPKLLITGSKCLLPRPCPSQEKIRNVQTDGLEPCSPKPLITGSKCLLPRPCPSQEKIRNVQMDGLEPCSPKPLITGSKCLLPRPCPSQEKIRNVQKDGLEPCSPKPLITGNKCLHPRPCPSQKNIRYVQTDGLEPCSPKPLITGSKCLLPRPCPSQEKIRNVQTDGLEPCSPKPLITGSKCLLPRPCPSQEKIRNVQTDGLEPCSPKPLITVSKCLLPRPCPSQEKIRYVQTDGLEPRSPKPLITGSKCLLPRPCPSQEKIRYVQTDGMEPRSPKPLITGSKCLLPRPCPSQEKIRYVQTDGLEPRSPKPLITGSKCLLPRPCPSQEKIRYVQTDGLEPCSLKPLITWSKCLLARPCPRQENIRHVQTDGLEPCLPKPLITGNKYLLPRPCPSQENIRYVQTDGLEPCSPKPLITGSKYLLPRPCPSQENIRYVQTDNKDTHAKLPSKPHMSYKQYYSKTAAKETQMFMESDSGTTTRIVNCTCSPLVQPNAMQDLEPDNTRKTLIHEQRFTAKPEMPRGAFMPSVPLERPPAESSKKKENIHINLVDVTLLNENCKHLLELHITRNVTEENHECPSSISSKTVDKLMAHMAKVSATSQCQTQPTNSNLHTSVISIRSDTYQKDANQETRSLQYNVFVSHFHKNPYMVFQHRHQLLMKHTKSEFKVHTEGLLTMEKVLFPKQSHLGGRHLKSRTTFLPFAEHNIINTVDWNLRHKLLRHLWGLAPLHHDDYKKSNTKDLLCPPPPAEVTANTELSEVESDFLMLTQRALLEQHIQMKTMHSGWGLPTLLRSSLQVVMASSPECSSIEACPQPEDEIVMIGEQVFFSPETTRKCVESHAKQRLMLQDFGLPNTAEESLAEFFPPSTCNEALASQKEATVDVPRLPASPASTKESESNDSALLVATSKKQKGMPYKIPKDAPVEIKPPMSKKKSVQKKRGLPQKIVDFFKALIVCKLPRSEETVDCYRISSVLGCPSFSVQIGKGHIELFNSSKELTIYSSDLSKIARTSFRVTDLHKHNDLYLQLIKRLCETGHGTIHSSLIESWTVFGTSHKLSIRTPPAISKTCLRRFRKLMFFVEQDAIDCIEKNLRQKHLMSKWWFPSPHTDSACKMALARKPAQQLTHRCRVAIESPSTKILSGDSLHQLELQIAKKCIEVRLGAIPLAVKISLKAMYSVQKEPLPKQTTVCKSPKFRNSAPIFGEQRILEPIEMNLKKKYLASLWGLPSLYVNSLMEKWLPLPPSAVHVGGINTVSSKEKLFLNEEIRELIELHVRKKRLHQELGLPFKLWKIFNWFTPRPSALSGPKKTKVNRVVLTKKLFFITQKTHLCLDYHIKRVQMQQRNGLPENIIQSLKHFMPSAPEIPESTPHSPNEECKRPLRDPVKGLSETRDATTRALVDAWDPKQHSQSSKQMSSPRETLKESKKTEIIFLQLHLVQKYIEIHLQQFPSRVVKSWNSVQTSEIDELAKTVLSSRISNLPRPTHLTFMEQFAIEQINQNLVHKHLMLMSAMAESSKTLASQACTWSTTHTRPKRAVMEFVDMQTSFLAGEKRDALKCHVDPERLQYDPTLPFASQRTTVLSPMPAKLTVTKPKFPTEVNIRPVELTFIGKATEEKLVSSSRSSLASRACGLSIDKELKPQKLQMSKQETPSRGRGPMFVLAKKRNTNIFKKWTKQRRARAMESKKHNVGTIRQCSVLDTLAIGAKWVDLNMNLENPPSLCGVLSPSTNLFPTTIHKPCSRGPRFNLDGPYIEVSAMETSFLGCKVRTHLDWHVRKKSLHQECSLPQVVQNSLQMLIPPIQHLLRSPYHREAKLKILPLIWKLEFIDEGIKEQLEFHIQRLIVQKRFGLSRHIQDELKQSLLSFPTSDAQTSDDQESVGSVSTRSEASLATKGSIAAEDKPQRFTDAYATTASQFNNQLEQHLPRKCLEVKTGVLPFLAERSLRITSSTMKTSLPKQIIQIPHVKPRATLVPFLEAENVHQVDMNIKHKHYMSFQVLKSLASPSRRHHLTSNEKSDPPFQPQSVFRLCSKNVTKIPPPVKHEDSLSPEEDLHHPNLLFGRPALRLTPQKDNPGARCKYQQQMAKHSDSWQVDLSLPKPLAQMSRVQKYKYMTWRHRDRNVSPSAAKANPLLRKTQHTTSTEREAHSLGSLHQNSPKRDVVSGDNDSLPDINDFQDIAKAIELHLQQKLVQSMLPHLQTPASKSVIFSTFTKSPTSLEETHKKCSTVSDAIVAYFNTPQNILELISIVNFHLRKRNFEIPLNPPCPVHDSPKLEPPHIDQEEKREILTMRDVSSQTLDAWDLPLGTSTPINTVSGSERNVEQKPCNRIASLFQASHGENSPAMPTQAGKDILNTSTDALSKMAARRASKSDCIASPVQRKATFLQNLMSKLKKSIFKYGQRKIKTKKGGVEVHGPSRESGLPLKKNTAQNPTSKVRGKEKVTKRTPKIPKANTKTSSKICPVHSTPKPGKPIKTISSPFSIGDTASSGQKTSDRETHKAEDLLEQNFRVDPKDIQDGRKSLKERRKSEHVASTPIAKEDTHSTRHTLYKETSKSTQEWEANWELMSGRTARIKQSSSPEWNVQPSTACTSALCVTVEYGLDSTKTHGESGEVMSLDVIAPRGRRHRGVKTPTIQGNSSTDKSTSLMSYYPVTGKRHADRGPGYSSLSTKSSSSRHKMFCWNISAEDHI